MFKAPFSFDGRIRRIEFFLSGLINTIVVYAVLAICGATAIVTSMATGNMGSAVAGLGMSLIVVFLVGIPSLWFFLAQGIKRLHDLNKSGWLILLCFVPILNWIFLLYMLFADGTVGPNQYGLDPKNRAPFQQAQPTVNVTVNVSKDKEEIKVEQSSEEKYAPQATPSKEEEKE